MRLARYLAVQLAAAVAVGWAVLWGLLWTVSWIEGIGHLSGTADGARTALWVTLLTSADAGWQLLPAAVVVGLVFSTSQLARRGELVAMLACGYSPAWLGARLLAVLAAIVGLAAAVGHYGLPHLAARAAVAERERLGKISYAQRTFGEAQHWFRSGPLFVYLPRSEEDAEGCFARPELYAVHDDALGAVGTARALCWRKGRWRLVDAELQAFSPTGGRADEAAIAAAVAALPEALHATHGLPKAQAGAELAALIARRHAAGVPSGAYRLELAARAAHPALALALAVLLLPWALRCGRRRSPLAFLGGAVAALAGALALAQLGRMLAAAGTLGPYVASWLPVGVCLALAPTSARRAREN